MKKFIFILIGPMLFAAGCKKSSLQLPNPNQPTPISLATEAGIQSFAMGIFQKWIASTSEGSANIMHLALNIHSNMGDEDFNPWANWGLRYPANVNTITLPAPYNKVIPNPSGFDQKGLLKAQNSRQAASANPLQYEWNVCYFMNSQANLLLSSLENPALQFSGDANTKKQLLAAWAYWWKGFAYSRIGSIYLAGVINNEAATGITTGNFIEHNAIIVEADANFDKASAILASLTPNPDYGLVFKSIVPSFNQNTNIITPEMWVRQINTYKARNYLVNRKVATMSPADWSEVTNFTANGMIPGDFSFMFGMNPGGTNDVSNNFFHPFAFHSLGSGFSWVSERFIQEFKQGDARFTRNFELRPGGPTINVRSRGIQFGTRYNVINIENGGSFATSNSLGAISIGGTWEENSLMIAEAKIRTGSDIEGGLAIIDQVRDAQNAGLAHVANTELSQAQAIEEFRRERRIALYLRGLAFYDARRWGITASAANGGGRANANVLVPGDIIGSTSAQIIPCFIDYDFLDYWDVPQNELDFNAAEPGSAPVAN